MQTAIRINAPSAAPSVILTINPPPVTSMHRKTVPRNVTKNRTRHASASLLLGPLRRKMGKQFSHDLVEALLLLFRRTLRLDLGGGASLPYGSVRFAIDEVQDQGALLLDPR